MKLVKIQEVFNSGLGIFADYKKELAECGYGGTNKLQQKILDEKFMDINQVAAFIKYCSTYARKKLRNTNVRYIIIEEKFYMVRADVIEQMQTMIKAPKVKKISIRKARKKKLQTLYVNNNLKNIENGAPLNDR